MYLNLSTTSWTLKLDFLILEYKVSTVPQVNYARGWSLLRTPFKASFTNMLSFVEKFLYSDWIFSTSFLSYSSAIKGSVTIWDRTSNKCFRAF